MCLKPASVMQLPLLLLLLLLLLLQVAPRGGAVEEPSRKLASKLVVLTVAREPTSESFLRFNRSVEANGLELTVLTASEREPAGSLSELELYRKALLNYRDNRELVALLADSSGTIINGNERQLLARFNAFPGSPRILFAADRHCWPQPELAALYPKEPPEASNTTQAAYLNSQTVIGFAWALWDLLSGLQEGLPEQSSESGPSETQAAQLFYTRAYLDSADSRRRLGIQVDRRRQLLQNLAPEDRVELEFREGGVALKNLLQSTEPLVVHGDRWNKIVLNSLGNYLAGAWTPEGGCRYCNDTIKLPSSDAAEPAPLPLVLVGLFVEEPTPFLEDFFQCLLQLDYPRSRLHLFLHNRVVYHEPHLEQFLAEISTLDQPYASLTLHNGTSMQARRLALDHCLKLDCAYYLSLDSTARLEAPETLRLLIEVNKPVLAPLLSRPTKLWSNFWGSLTEDGFYARSHDYVALVKRQRQGLWNVPLLLDAYLLRGSLITQLRAANASTLANGEQRPEVVWSDQEARTKPGLLFSQELRLSGADQFMLNTHEFGHLVDPTSYNVSRRHPDFYQLQENMLDWERQYLHENYSQLLADEQTTKLEEPCQDVFWFPLVSERFCDHLVQIMEHHNQWSAGSNEDPRIEGGYESVPTRDIHLRQVGLHEMWLEFLRDYVTPIQLREFIGYDHDPPRADLAFVVRYKPSEQPSLKPHHDSSTYTLNIALNEPGSEYSGGGCRFVRYNCSVIESRRGWALLHPGRLTHYHEGLPVTNGTRYIMVTFVDP